MRFDFTRAMELLTASNFSYEHSVKFAEIKFCFDILQFEEKGLGNQALFSSVSLGPIDRYQGTDNQQSTIHIVSWLGYFVGSIYILLEVNSSPPDKMDAFKCIQISFVYFLRVQLTISEHWLR